MRDINFRGMDRKGRWWFGSASFGNGNWYNIKKKCCVIPETVGQYTGLKDADEVEIYEGDIIKQLGNKFYDFVVIFENGCFLLRGLEDILMNKKCGNIVVVGNIHEKEDKTK